MEVLNACNSKDDSESETSGDESSANQAFGAAKKEANRKRDHQQQLKAMRMLLAFFGDYPGPTKSISENPTTATSPTISASSATAAALAVVTPVPVPPEVHPPVIDAIEPQEKPAESVSSLPESTPQATPIQQQQQPARCSNWNKVPVRQRKKKLSPRTIARRLTRKYKTKSFYHSVAEKNRLGSIHEDIFLSDSEGDDDSIPSILSPPPPPITISTSSTDKILSPPRQAKRDLLQALNQTLGDTKTPAFQMALQNLLQYYVPPKPQQQSSRDRPSRNHRPSRSTREQQQQQQSLLQMEGIGISAGKPTFPGCIGRNDAGDPMYKLGTMSFDMFCPTQLVVSVQGTFVVIDTVDGSNPQAVEHIPKDLLADVRFGRIPVRSYNIVTPFTIEPWKEEFGDHSPNRGITDRTGIRGVMTTYGFILPYPKQSHRFSVWFTRGTLEVVSGGDDDQTEKWFQIFDSSSSAKIHDQNTAANSHKRTMAESGKLLAAKLLMGASTNDQLDEDGKLSYTLTRPRSNHIDLIYLDKTLQVLRASSGTVYVHVRLPGGRKAIQKASNAQATKQGLYSAIMPPPLVRPSDSFVYSSDDDDDDDSSIDDPVASRRRQPQGGGGDVWTLPNTIDAKTQSKVAALMQGGNLKQAAELLQRAHSNNDLLYRERQKHNGRFRCSTSENNLQDGGPMPVRKRIYAAEA